MAFEYWFLLVAVAAFAYTVYQKRLRGWLFRWCEGMPKRRLVTRILLLLRDLRS
jgi:hypothetical protein